MQLNIPATSAWRICSSPTRLCGLDALRGIAAILVVLLHAGVPYMTNPFPYLVWPARDAHPCPLVDGLTWCTECFLMPLFFVLAGFFSNGLLMARGERDFLSGRTKRLLYTQLAAFLVILPICLGIWILGWIADGLYLPQNPFGFRIPKELRAELYGTGHLWFLQYLYIYSLTLCGVSWTCKRIGSRQPSNADGEARPLKGLDKIFVSVWKPLIPAIPCAMILYWDPRIVLGFYQTFIPVISKLVYYAVYFSAGVLIYRQRNELQLHARFGKTYLVISGVLFAAVLPLIHEHTTVALTGPRLALLATLLALFACFTTFGLLAIFLRTKHGDNAVTRYLAESSFWVYLIHLPFVGLTQIAIVQLPIPTVMKFLLAGTTAFVLALLTYHVLVRHTWLGEFLDGRRRSENPTMKSPELVYSHSTVSPGYASADSLARSGQRAVHQIPHGG